ncbi:tRNA (N6-isopentenyl adenosine(37)-C2)-methylthiotransferase MiaB [Ruminococcus sp.]|uniref:tRNA (N6-isopentenyl adenosine(37)-C2)-methylthiotransferase MiaB n=1 Tax=Ruminococcus sp. TaxID=41978 RepID=UPI0025DEDF60|nr:tRNA (N6-isopentenyl adenosine(37)-C2)-methylthiotransferase MiaB [Ruminococcus sp.]MDD7555477.1 tRNA (N6-isopentenyl adenosine(37)-C2)-methylthiotransferase MiaB [Ruminococcus sp.]MDY4964257.1 tRNA (N6-isopentenyl adenosine(37)-C2)-methylthiotransferase MiaB [Ruminococcus callidus]
MEQEIRAVRERLAASEAQPLAMVQSFGCQLNMTDGEKLKWLLLSMGYGLTEEPEQADLILLNTCAVREHAEDRVFGHLGQLKPYKQKKPGLIIGLCGCMTAEETVREKLKASYPYVNLVVGTGALERLPAMLLEILEGKKHSVDPTVQSAPSEELSQVRSCAFKASVPIMYGCNNFCTYCIVPYVRGRERSRDPKIIEKQVRELVAQGCKEIFLLGQNVNSYGKDLPEGIRFPELLRRLDAIEGDFWIRFMSSHPKDATPELIDVICGSRHIEKHLHLPVQSGNDTVLRAMNRCYTVEKYLETVRYARSRVPDFALTTDIIVGFPNETDEEFSDTLGLLEQVGYDNVYAFIYSPRSGTKAAQIQDHTPAQVKTERMQRLLSQQRETSTRLYRRFLGRTMRVLFEGISRKGEPWLTGKSSEGVIVEAKGDPSRIGTFADVHIEETKNWAVLGTILD